MRIVLDLPAPIAQALQHAAQAGGGDVLDLVIEAVRSSELVQNALADHYPPALMRRLFNGESHD